LAAQLVDSEAFVQSEEAMRRTIWILALLLPALVWALQLLEFSGEVVEEDAVRLSWRVDTVQGVAGFELERSTDNELYRQIGERLPASGLDYSVLDRPGLNGSGGEVERGGARVDAAQTYYYRLWIVLPSGERQPASSEPIEVSFQMSTVSLTWGGIKAMFR
jgi:hypothetical protein